MACAFKKVMVSRTHIVYTKNWNLAKTCSKNPFWLIERFILKCERKWQILPKYKFWMRCLLNSYCEITVCPILLFCKVMGTGNHRPTNSILLILCTGNRINYLFFDRGRLPLWRHRHLPTCPLWWITLRWYVPKGIKDCTKLFQWPIIRYQLHCRCRSVVFIVFVILWLLFFYNFFILFCVFFLSPSLHSILIIIQLVSIMTLEINGSFMKNSSIILQYGGLGRTSTSMYHVLVQHRLVCVIGENSVLIWC